MLKATILKVLHIGKYYPPFSGGIENFTAALLPALSRHGTDIRALVHNHGPLAGRTRTDIVNGIPVHRVPSHGRILYAPVSPLFPAVFNRIVKGFRPDLLHIHMPNTSAFWTLFLPAAVRIPGILHWHSDVVPSTVSRGLDLAYRFYRPFEYRLLRYARAVIATSPPYLASSRPLAPFKHKTRTVPLALPAESGETVSAADRQWSELLWGNQSARILAVGRLTYYKGHRFLVDAMERIENAKLIIVGEGELKGEILRRVTDKGLDTRITLTGHLEAGRLEALLRSCDFVVLPSIERTEAFGLVLLEAMRAGKPAIVTTVEGSGMSWIVRHGETGLHVPPMNPHRLAQAIQTLAGNPDMAGKMGKAAKERFNRHFTMEKAAASVLGIYKRCPGKKF